ncbi:MAG: choice-of-anchor D domain-containing protein, partial [Acidobacteriales bacterium]|nr:choice-of-anchor D domain-containing protein [Terriglobales bacterium]
TVADNVTGGSSTLTLTGTGVTAAGVTLSSSAVTFPSTDVNSVSAAIPVTLTNNGSGALTIVSILVNGTNASNFSQTNTCGTVVAAGASCVINATFAPTATGARSASITVTDNASPATQTITLAGTGVTPTISLAPTSLAFGNQAQGLTSAPLSSVLTNTGTGPLIITAITVGGTNSTDFTQSSTCPISPATLAVGSTCTITATFTPTAQGVRNASITIADNVTSGNPSLPLSGTGTTPASVSLSPTSLSFPATDVNSLSAPLPVTLTNTGNGTLTITSVTLTGLNATNYSQTNTCGTSVAAGASCVINVTFAPTVTGTRTASLTITDNASPATQTVALTGSAVTPTITMSPTSIVFPNTTDGTTSAPLSTTLTNTGTGPLIITSIVLGGTNAADFSQVNTCPISPNTLPVNGTCSITATFTPTAMSSRSATITINSNALGTAKTVALSGTGIAFTVSYTPSSWAFPSTIVGVSSTSKTITLKNLGSINLNITGVQITGANPGDFSQTNTCGTTVLPNASCTFSVVFTPQGTGPRSAALSVTDNGDGSPQAVALTGTGTQPLVSVSPSSLVYTTQQYNTASKTQKVTVTNNGTAALTITAIGFTGTNATDFTDTTTCPISTGMLAVGSSCTVTVTFTPKGMGPRSANLSITDNAPASPQVAALTGTGTFAKLTPTTLAFTAITVGRSSGAKTVTFTNVGNASLTMNGISLTGANPGDFTQTNTCGTSVAPGGTCTVTVTFKPTALGARAANLYFDDSDGAGPQTVTLTGTGI